MSIPGKPSGLIKPTLHTKFHVDYEWWERSPQDLRTYLLSHLLPEQRERLSQIQEERMIDYIDTETGEVYQLNEFRLAIQDAAKAPDFINMKTSLVDSIFRVFLKNNNKPLSPQELADATGRSATTILKTLRGARIYKGIRPYKT